MKRLARKEGGKIILLVMDGLGGLPIEPGGPTELEAANTPNLDRLAKEGSTGMSIPIARGVEPGSGPAHLALFGYDPLVYDIGRGVLESLGINFDLTPQDVAARGNFCTVDDNGVITDRRAGRIATDKAAEVVERLTDIKLPGVELTVREVKEHRFAIRLRGKGLSPHVRDTDPQATGAKPLSAEATADTKEAKHTAELVNQFLAEAAKRLKGHPPANMLTLRGFAGDPALPKFQDVYRLNPACVAVYPMYRGVASLVGMKIVETDAHDDAAAEFNRVKGVWDQHDFIFCHIKYTDSRGEDGDFNAKKAVIEQVDQALPILLDLKPDTLIVTGDHSTPARLKSHSWHPVPVLLYAPATHMPDRAQCFGERECMTGALGQFPATDLMQFALAHAHRLDRYGA
jgi:2,3-bisphosphoglycerate-independent phosphoglycerate mutase